MQLRDRTVDDFGDLRVGEARVQKSLHNDRFPEGSQKPHCDVLGAIQGRAVSSYEAQEATTGDCLSVYRVSTLDRARAGSWKFKVNHISGTAPFPAHGDPVCSDITLVFVRRHHIIEGFSVLLSGKTSGGHREGGSPGLVRTIEPSLLTTRTQPACETPNEAPPRHP